jgi:hypothetical protein
MMDDIDQMARARGQTDQSANVTLDSVSVSDMNQMHQ